MAAVTASGANQPVANRALAADDTGKVCEMKFIEINRNMRDMMRLRMGWALLATLLGGWLAPHAAAGAVSVFVSIAPQKYFVQQIGKQLVDVQVMVPPGADPHTYEPRPRQMVALSTAALYFAIGIEFESARLDKIAAANPRMAVVHTDAGIRRIAMTAGHHGKAHHHGEEDRHGGDGLDPHIWLSPPLVRQQAVSIRDALKRVDPGNAAAYDAHCREFTARIDRLDVRFRTMFEGKRGLRFMVFHPSWGYFAHSYGLEQVPIEVEGKRPKPAQLAALIERAREKGIRVIFVQPQFSRKSADLIAREIGGRVVFADPLAEDWAANLQAVADEFQAALR